MNAVTGILYAICSTLLVPVVIVLLAFLAWTVVLLGGFLRELLQRRRLRGLLNDCIAAARRRDPWESILARMRRGPSGPVSAFCRRVEPGEPDPAALGHALSSIEHEISGSMAKLSFLTRSGPMLGLMGTLIPLGPALMGLSSGNTRSLAQNLVVAFATTVIGVLIGILAYGMGLARRAWYAHDLDDLERVCEHLEGRKAGRDAA